MRVAILIAPTARCLEIAGPFDVFSTANMLMKTDGHYEMQMIASSSEPMAVSHGLRLTTDRTIADPVDSIDTLFVAGPHDAADALAATEVIAWVARHAPSIRRCCAGRTGAFILAAAGLLDGRRATTHWRYADEFIGHFPSVRLEPDRIFIKDGPIWTSAGVSTGIDMALALLEEDHGRALSLEVARFLVVFLKRPGGQSQFSAYLASQIAARTQIQKVQSWVLEHLTADLSTEALAASAGMSVRNFTRVFQDEAKSTPTRFVERARLDAARRLLEESDLPLKRIASSSGFGTIGRMRRAFRRQVSVGPLEYRRRFQSTIDAPGSGDAAA